MRTDAEKLIIHFIHQLISLPQSYYRRSLMFNTMMKSLRQHLEKKMIFLDRKISEKSNLIIGKNLEIIFNLIPINNAFSLKPDMILNSIRYIKIMLQICTCNERRINHSMVIRCFKDISFLQFQCTGNFIILRDN